MSTPIHTAGRVNPKAGKSEYPFITTSPNATNKYIAITKTRITVHFYIVSIYLFCPWVGGNY